MKGYNSKFKRSFQFNEDVTEGFKYNGKYNNNK